MRPPGRRAMPAITIVAIATLAGCVSLPTGGRVSDTGSPGSNGSEQVVQLVPRPPGRNWGPEEIVMGFLAASGSMLSGGSSSRSVLNSRALAVAQDYLTPSYRKRWLPNPLSLTVIDSSLAGLSISAQKVAPPPNRVPAKIVYVTSNHVETLQRVGQIPIGNIVVSPGKTFDFSLYQISGQWRIDSLPNRLLLTQPDFLRDYQPRDLYFLAKGNPSHLVPYPVFMPAQAQTQAGAQELANDLLESVQNGANGAGPPGWLNEATTTAFPAGAKIGGVEVSDVKATVYLDLPASAKPTDSQVDEMEAQLVWTLTSSPYGGASGVGSVQLVIRHGRSELLLPGSFTSWVPSVGGGPLYFQSLGALGQPVIYTRGRSGSTRMPTPAGLGTGLFTDIAVPPAGTGPALLGACRGNVIYLAPLRYRAHVIKQTLPSRCTSLSWDDNGNLWVTSGITVYMLESAALLSGAQVGPSREKVTSSLELPAHDTVSSFHVAPDGVRAAMIVRSRTGSKVFVAAISTYAGHHFLALSKSTLQVGSEIADPMALAWQNPDDLLVLGSAVSGGSRYLFQVPLNGAPSVPSSVAVPRGALWLTADSLGVAVGGPGGPAGQIWLLRTWNGGWQQTAILGSTPDYAG
jgi:hypothetical protein